MSTNDQVLRELHKDLARKYKRHGAVIDSYWRSFDTRQRTTCVKAGAVEGTVLKHRKDPSLGNVSKFIPEWNLRDLTEANSDFLLDMLHHRASHSLSEQYCAGLNNGPGDHAHILEMMHTRNLRHVESFKNEMTMFFDHDGYGKSFKGLTKDAFAGPELEAATQAGLMVPRSTGELIIARQEMLLQLLNTIVEDILEEGSKTRDRKSRAKDHTATLTTAVSALAVTPRPVKLSLTEIITTAKERSSSLDQYLSLLSMEPVVLVHEVNVWFFSQPGFVPDEKGRILGVHTDKYISAAVLDSVHNAIRSAATWNYISRLLDLLDVKADKMYRAIIVQELSNITHLEYARAQGIFKRHVQSGIGKKLFKRLSNITDKAGNPRVALKRSPEELTRADPQLHYVVRLCQPETTPSSAANWIKQLAELHDTHPPQRERLEEREIDALANLASIIAFIHDISPVISMPPLSRKKGQLFVRRSQDLEIEINQLRERIDLLEFAAPLDNLLEPGMAAQAMESLENFVAEATGTKMGFLYQDLIDECFTDLEHQYDKLTAKADSPVSTLATPPVPEVLIQQRRLKEKTRPTHSSIFDIGPPQHESNIPATIESPQAFKVSPATADVFSTMFDKTEARGSVSWDAFRAAMAELGFTITPRGGSIFTFSPPETMDTQMPLSLHRPHASRFERWKLLPLAKRLNRTYGWGQSTVEVV